MCTCKHDHLPTLLVVQILKQTAVLKPYGTRYNAENVSPWALDVQFANSSGSAVDVSSCICAQ